LLISLILSVIGWWARLHATRI